MRANLASCGSLLTSPSACVPRAACLPVIFARRSLRRRPHLQGFKVQTLNLAPCFASRPPPPPPPRPPRPAPSSVLLSSSFVVRSSFTPLSGPCCAPVQPPPCPSSAAAAAFLFRHRRGVLPPLPPPFSPSATSKLVEMELLNRALQGGGCSTNQQCMFSGKIVMLIDSLIYRMKQPKIVLLIFVSGKIVLTGAKMIDETHTSFENIYPVLRVQKSPAMITYCKQKCRM